MPRVLVVSDVHIHNHARHGGGLTRGVNERAALALWAFEEAVALVERGDDMIVAGDLFHTLTPDPGVVRAANNIARNGKFSPGKLCALKGNHDALRSRGYGDTALGYLSAPFLCVEDTEVIRCGGMRILAIPFERGSAEGHLSALLSEPSKGVDAIIGHYGIRTRKSPSFLRSAEDYVDLSLLVRLARYSKARFVLMGHDHRHAQWEVNGVHVVQIGALGPTSFGDDGDAPFGWVVVLDPNRSKPTYRHVPGPRFYTVATESDLHKLPSELVPGMFVRFGFKPPSDLINQLATVGAVVEVLPVADSEEMDVDLQDASSLDIRRAIQDYVRRVVPKPLRKETSRRAVKVWEKAQSGSLEEEDDSGTNG